MGISEHPAEKNLHDNRGLKKIIFEKPLTVFGFVIWSSPRWHHCQAETISSESPKNVGHKAESSRVATGSQ
jgi:hypothetical protein